MNRMRLVPIPNAGPHPSARRWTFALFLGVLLVSALAACGDGGGGGVFGGGSRMTVEEFATACVKLEQRFSGYEPASPAAAAGVYEDLFGEIESWNPPEELAQWHKTYIRVADAALQALRESGFLDLAEDMAQAEEDEDAERMMELSERMGELAGAFERFETELAGLGEELEQVAQDVPPQVRQALEDAGCTILD